MSSSQAKLQSKNPANNYKASKSSLRCWEYLSCNKVLCPAFGKKDAECWFVPRTHCNGYPEEDLFTKLHSCLDCPYFIERAGQDPGGWASFIAEQMRDYNIYALKQVQSKEKRLVEILDRIPDGLFTTDEEWRITYFNPAAERITGFSAYDAVGMFCKDVFKNPKCETDCALKKAIEGGIDVHNREYEILNIDNQKIPIICSSSAFRNNSGRVTGGVEIFKDISQQKRLQEEVVRREKKYRRIFEDSHDMIYTTNLQGDLLDINQAGVSLLGYGSKEKVLQGVSAEGLYYRPEDRYIFLKKINENGYVKDFEVDFKRRDGSPIRVLISSSRYENSETGDIEYEGIIKDITRRKKAEVALKQRNLELSIINEIAKALNCSLNLDYILEVTLKQVLKALRLENGGIFLINQDENKISCQVQYGLVSHQHSNGKDEVIFKDKILEQELLKGYSLLEPEAYYPSFRVTYKVSDNEQSQWLSGHLISYKGQAIGFIGLSLPQHRKFNIHEIHLLGSIGNFLGGAIENTKLVDTIQLHRYELKNLTENLFKHHEEENRRIARELHDESSQSLTAIKLGMERLAEKISTKCPELSEDINGLYNQISDTSLEIRQLSHSLHPTLLSDMGLKPALERYFNQVGFHSDIQIEFKVIGFDKRLDIDMETILYRFSQEAMTNTLKHAKANRFRLSIIKSYPHISFFAEDDGIGFDLDVLRQTRKSLGLISMRERAALYGGYLWVRSKPGKGTKIRIKLPVAENHSHD